MKPFAMAAFLAALALPTLGAPAASTNNPAAPADQKPSIMLKVKRAQSTDKSSDSGSYYYYKSTTSGLVLDAEVRSLSKNPVTLQLEWYFVAKTMSGDRQWICDSGSKTLELGPPVIAAKERLTSRVLQGSDSSSYHGSGYYGYGYTGGSKIDGYIVLVKWKDKIMKVVGSTKTLEDLAYSPDKLKKLMTTPDWQNSPGGSGGSSTPSSRGNRGDPQQ